MVTGIFEDVYGVRTNPLNDVSQVVDGSLSSIYKDTQFSPGSIPGFTSTSTTPGSSAKTMLSKALVALATIHVVAAYVVGQTPLLSSINSLEYTQVSESCKQSDILVPKQTEVDEALENLYNTPSFKIQTNDALSALIRIK